MKLRGECNRCGLCCQMTVGRKTVVCEHLRGAWRLRAMSNGQTVGPMLDPCTQCNVYDQRYDGMPIKMLDPATREVVLQYLGGNVGTVGPLSKTAKKEFSVLAASDQARAGALIDLGGEAFLVYKDAALNRIVIVAGRKVVGDFTVPPKP